MLMHAQLCGESTNEGKHHWQCTTRVKATKAKKLRTLHEKRRSQLSWLLLDFWKYCTSGLQVQPLQRGKTLQQTVQTSWGAVYC